MFEAARVTDEIEHTFALAGFIAGAILGALVIGAAAFFAASLLIPPCCFLAGLVIGMAVGYFADEVGHGIAAFGEKVGSMFTSAEGPLIKGSHNVVINNKKAIGAVFSHAICKKHSGRVESRVAQGSESIAINNQPASRIEDKLECGAKIAEGSDNVFFGGEPVSVLPIDDEVPQWIRDTAEVLFVVAGLLGGAAGAMKAAGKTGIKCFGKFLAGEVAGYAAMSFLFGSPVDSVTGRKVLIDESDVSLLGKFPLSVERSYDSDSVADSVLGKGWMLAFEMRLIEEKDELVYYTRHGRELRFPHIPLEDKIFLTNESIWVAHLSKHRYLIYSPFEEYFLFERLNDDSGQFNLKRVENRQAEHVVLEYDLMGDQHVIKTLKDSSGNHVILHYKNVQLGAQEAPRLKLITQHISSGETLDVAKYNYNQNGQLIEIHNIDGTLVRAFSYDENGLMITHTDAKGKICEYEWKAFEDRYRVIRHKDNSGQFFSFEYYIEEQKTIITNAHKNQATVIYNDEGFITQHQDFDKLVHKFEYDDDDNLIRIAYPHQLQVNFTLDPTNRIVEIIEKDLKTKEEHNQSFQYDGNSQRITQYTDKNRQNWRTQYNKLGQIIATTTALKAITRYEYNDKKELIKVIDAGTHEYHFVWNSRGQITEQTDCSGHKTYYNYNALGYLISARNALEQTVIYQYSLQGYLTSITHPDDSTETFQYDPAGQLIGHTDQSGYRTKLSYDCAGRVITQQDRLDRILRYQYDALGRVTDLINQNGARYKFGYDPVGRLLTEDRPDNTAFHYGYDDGGLLQTSTQKGNDGSLRNTSFEIDAWNRLLTKTTEESIYHYCYDVMGRLLGADSSIKGNPIPQSQLSFTYDIEGKLINETSHLGILCYEHDVLGNLIEAKLPDGNRINYARYGSGHVHGILWNGQSVTDFERNALHFETKRTLGSRALTTEYDRLNRIASHDYAHRAPNHPLVSSSSNTHRAYEYNKQNELIKVHDAIRGTQHYTYDKEGRLTGHFSDRNGQLQGDCWERFIYDAADNLLDLDTIYSVPDQIQHKLPPILDNRLTKYKGVEYRYNTFGEMIERMENNDQHQFRFNASGELVYAQGRYAFHSNNSPVLMQGLNSQYYKANYTYDALGRRIAKKVQSVDKNGDVNGSEEQTEFLWMGMQMVQEHQSKISYSDLIQQKKDATSKSIPLTQNYTYIYQADGRYEPIAQIKNSETIHFYQNHINGAPTELIDWEGNVLWAEHQNAWGKSQGLIEDLRADELIITHQPLRFQGQYFDHETGLHYNTFRYYDAHIGRFISQDPIGLAGGINLYQYAPNPIHWIDPWGLTPGAGYTHITYEGIKNGKPYIGYASKPGLGHSAEDVLKYRYGNDFSGFDKKPEPFYRGEGSSGKATARGLEQRVFEDRGGLQGTSNKQNPVGEHNARRAEYLSAADEHRANKSGGKEKPVKSKC